LTWPDIFVLLIKTIFNKHIEWTVEKLIAYAMNYLENDFCNLLLRKALLF